MRIESIKKYAETEFDLKLFKSEAIKDVYKEVLVIMCDITSIISDSSFYIVDYFIELVYSILTRKFEIKGYSKEDLIGMTNTKYLELLNDNKVLEYGLASTFKKLISKVVISIDGILSNHNTLDIDKNDLYYCILKRLMKKKPLTPLLGTTDEWEPFYDEDGSLLSYTNKRCDTVVCDICIQNAKYNEAKIFTEGYKDVKWFDNTKSPENITFPFIVPDQPKLVRLESYKLDEDAGYFIVKEYIIDEIDPMYTDYEVLGLGYKPSTKDGDKAIYTPLRGQYNREEKRFMFTQHMIVLDQLDKFNESVIKPRTREEAINFFGKAIFDSVKSYPMYFKDKTLKDVIDNN